MGTSDRRPYLTATTLDQALLNECTDNLTIQLEMIADIEDVGTGAETLRISDRAKYVGGNFYEPRTTFPVLTRTVGDFLANQLEFSNLQLTINNADGKFNYLLPGENGGAFDGWIGRRIVVKAGLLEDATTYTIVFSGEVTDVSGFSRGTDNFTLTARSDFEKVNVSIPTEVLLDSDFPDIEEEFLGLGAPVIYGDWTTNIRTIAPEVPAYPVNGLDPLVNASLDPPHVNVGDTPLRLVISQTPISVFDDTSVTLFRNEEYYTFPDTDITIVPLTNNTIFDITQKNLTVNGSPWIYETGDQFFLKVEGIDLGVGLLGNIVAQGRDILERFGGLTAGDFDASWATIQAKAAPPESAISLIESRVWIQEGINAMEYVLSLFEQVRIEPFVDRNNKFKLTTLHFEDFNPSPSVIVKNWHIKRGTFKPETDERSNFNRAKADFSLSPVTGEARRSTPIFRNDVAITQVGRPISKLIAFPNLVIQSDVERQLKEILKLASAYSEFIDVDLTWYGQQLDIGDEVEFFVQIGALQFANVSGGPDDAVTGKIRSVGYSPSGEVRVRFWSFMMLPFPGSLKAGYSGITGGSTATITQEL